MPLTRHWGVAALRNAGVRVNRLGPHGHGAGSAIGFWDNQKDDLRGAYAVRANTTWSIELTNYSAVPEWGGQKVDFRSEEDAYFDGKSVRYLDGRQTELTLIPSD